MSEHEVAFELQVGGTVPLETGAYVVRHSDKELLSAVREGEYCNVLCPRQMGKTSTIFRIRAELRKETGWRLALIDIAGCLGTPASDVDWFLGLLGEINKQFALGIDVKAWWGTRPEPTANQKLLAFFREETIGRHSTDQFVVFLDEIDHTLNLPYTDDFFLAIRSLYNDRASEPNLRRLTFCLVGVFTPNELVKQQRTTTYNIGQTFELQDFDLERDDLSPLTRVLSADPAQGRTLLDAVLAWTGGQPYLTASACKKVAATGATTEEEVNRTIEEAFLSRVKPLEASDGTHFENIARFLGQRVFAQLETVQLYRKILKGGEELDRPTPPVLALKLSGLVKTDRQARLAIRNRIYRQRFDRKWTATVVPLGDRWARRAVAGLTALVVLLVSLGYFWIYPAAIAADLAGLTDDYKEAKRKWSQLREIPFWMRKADEGWADYQVRRSTRAARVHDRDAALLWRLRAVEAAVRDIDRRAVQSLALADYPALKRTFRQAGGVSAVAFSPGGNVAITGSSNGTARLWDTRSSLPIGEPLQHKEKVAAVAFSPDGNTVITGSYDGSARLWDARSGSPVGEPLQHKNWVTAVVFSPGGDTVLTGSLDGTARLWDARSSSPVGGPLQHKASVTAVAFSADGKTVITGSDDGTSRLWDSRSGLPVGVPLQHKQRVTDVVFSPGGDTVLTGSEDGTARLWDARSGLPVGVPLHHQESVRAVAFSALGEAVITCSDDGTARLWDARSGLPIGEPLQHQDSVFDAAFSPGGKIVVTGSRDATARLWDARSGLPIGPPLHHQESVLAVAFSPDGNTVLTSSNDGTARLWKLRSSSLDGKPLEPRGWVQAVAFSPGGNVVITGSSNGTARLWDTRSSLPIGEPLQHKEKVAAVAFSPDGNTVITGSYDGSARLWDARSGSPVGEPLQHKNRVTAVVFSPGGDTVLTGSLDGTARLWDARSGTPIGEPLRHWDGVTTVAFSPRGDTVLTGSLDGIAQLWDAKSGLPVRRTLRHEAGVIAVAFSPGGETIVTSSMNATARLWKARSGLPFGEPLQFNGPVAAITFSPSGDTVLTGSLNGTAQLWDARSGSPVGEPIQHKQSVLGVAFSPDARIFITVTLGWLHEFAFDGNEATLVSSFYLGTMISDAFRFDDPKGHQLTVLTTAGQASLRKIAIDFSNFEPLPGEPAALIEDLEQRLGMKIDDQGRLMTTAGDEWIEGVGIRQISHEPKRPSIRNPDSVMFNETDLEN